MLIWISHRSYRAYYPYVLQSLYWYFLSYTYSELTLIADLFLFRSPVGHIFILISRRMHTYIDSSYTVLNLYIYLDGGTYPHTHTFISLILVQISRRSYRVYAYTKVPLGTTRLILILRSLHLFGGTRRYYKDITEDILVLRNLFLYGSTRKYYLLKCPKRHILVIISNL